MTDWTAKTVRDAQQGDLEAFERLVRAHQDMVFAVCIGELGSVAAAEEAAQDAFLDAWRQIAQLRDPNRFSGWLRSVAKNLARKSARSRQRVSRRESQYGESRCTSAPSGEHLLLIQEQRAFVEGCLAALPQSMRATAILHIQQGLSTRQVAQQLQISEAAVRQRIGRVRSTLRSEAEERFAAASTSRDSRSVVLVGVLSKISASNALQVQRSSRFRVRVVAGALVGLAGIALLVGPWLVQTPTSDASAPDSPASDNRHPGETRIPAQGSGSSKMKNSASKATKAGAGSSIPMVEVRLSTTRKRSSFPSSKPWDGAYFVPNELPRFVSGEAPQMLVALHKEVRANSLDERARKEAEVNMLRRAMDDGASLSNSENLSDPWKGLFGLIIDVMYLEWNREADGRQMFDYARNNQNSETPERDAMGMDWKPVEFSSIVRSSDTLIEQFPTHRLADTYRLFKVYAEGAVPSNTDMAPWLDSAVSIAVDTKEPVIQRELLRLIAQRLNLAREEHLGAVDFASLESALDGTIPPESTAQYAELRAEIADRRGDTSSVQYWNDEFTEAVRANCASSNSDAARCEAQSMRADIREGILAHAQNRSANGWRADLIRAAKLCIGEHPVLMNLETLTERDGQWTAPERPKPSSSDNVPYFRCVTKHATNVPEGLVVELFVTGF